MFSYEAGLAVSFLVWLASIISLLVSINSRLETNLNKIGQRLSWLTLTPTPMDLDDVKRSAFSKVMRFALIVGISLPLIFLSWLYVAMLAGIFVYRCTKDSGAPQVVREFRWKLKNAEMTFDQLVKEMMKVAETDPADFDKYRDNLVDELKGRGLHAGQGLRTQQALR